MIDSTLSTIWNPAKGKSSRRNIKSITFLLVTACYKNVFFLAKTSKWNSTGDKPGENEIMFVSMMPSMLSRKNETKLSLALQKFSWRRSLSAACLFCCWRIASFSSRSSHALLFSSSFFLSWRILSSWKPGADSSLCKLPWGMEALTVSPCFQLECGLFWLF